MKKSLLYISVFAAVQLITGFMVQTIVKLWFQDVSTTSPTVIMVSSAVSSCVLLTIFLALRWYTVSRTYMRTRPWGVLTWTALLAFGITIPLTRLEECIPDAWMVDLMAEEVTAVLKSSTGYFVICMLAPLVEEVIFRGAVLESLLKACNKGNNSQDVTSPLPSGQGTGVGVSICLSALFFALCHFNPAQMPHAFIVGIILGWLYVRTRSIIPGLLIHWINNSIAYAMINLFPMIPADAKLAAYFGGDTSAVNQAVVFSLMIALPALYQLYVRLR